MFFLHKFSLILIIINYFSIQCAYSIVKPAA